MSEPSEPPVVVEVNAPFACFTRPELKSERFSYAVMTPSAATGVLESIFWKPEFTYAVDRIEVLARPKWMQLRRNEVKSVITLNQVRKMQTDPTARYDASQDRDQRNAVILRDVAYRIHAHLILHPHADSPAAKYRAQLRRRITRGSCYSTPYLGCREFSATFGDPTPRRLADWTEDLGVMLHSINYVQDGTETYRWFHAKVDKGVLAVPSYGVELPTAAPVSGRRV